MKSRVKRFSPKFLGQYYRYFGQVWTDVHMIDSYMNF